jgi:hypothetical protein
MNFLILMKFEILAINQEEATDIYTTNYLKMKPRFSLKDTSEQETGS